MNGAFFDPELRTLVISANLRDILLQEEDKDRVVLTVTGLDEGIEIVHNHDRLWRPV